MKFRLFASVAATLALLSSGEAIAATTYYVTPATQGTEDGSLAAPFKTIQGALGVAVDGDTVLVGRGNYDLGTTRAIPAGVIVRGGYAGGWGAGAWAASNPAVYASAVTGTYRLFTVNARATLEGMYLHKYANGDWAVDLQGAGAQFRKNNLRFEYHGVYTNGNGVTVETSKITQTEFWSCCYYAVYAENNSALKFQDNVLHAWYGYGLYLNSARAVIRRNEFYNDSSSWYAISGRGWAHIYQNFFNGLNYSNTAISPNSSSLFVIENNNFTGWYTSLYGYSYDEVWGWSFPIIGRNNAILNGTAEAWGNLDTENYPVDNNIFTGNCVGPTNFYVYGYEGSERFPASVAEFEAIPGLKVSGNVAMTTQPATPKSPACGNKGIVSTPMSTKPIAHGYAYDDITGPTYASDLAVGPGMLFTLNGASSWGGTESINFEGGDLTYAWTAVAGNPSAVTLWPNGNAEEVTAVVTTPGTYKFQLRVRNQNPGADNVLSDPFIVTVQVQSAITVLTAAGAARGSYRFLQDALDAAQSGDTVQLPAGLFMQGEDSRDSGELYYKSNITIKGAGSAAGGTKVMMRCNDFLDIEYANNITVRDLAFTDAEDCGYYAIYGYSVSNLLIDNIAYSNKSLDPWYGYAIYLEYVRGTIQNSKFAYMEYPIYVDYGNYVIRNNTFDAIYYYSIEADGMSDGMNSLEIANNAFDMKFYNNDYVLYLYDLDYQGPYNIRDNTFRNMYYDAMYVDNSDYGPGVNISGNTIANDRRWLWHYDYGIQLYYSNAMIENNIIYSTGYSGIYNYSSDGWSENEVGVRNNVIAYANEDYFGIENYYGSVCPNGDTNSVLCRFIVWAQGNVLWGNGAGSYRNVDIRDGNLIADPKFADANNFNFTPAADSPIAGKSVGTQAKGGVAPGGLRGEALESAVRVTFEPVQGALGYKVYWGETADDFGQSKDLGFERVAVIDGLAAKPYYFAVSSRNAAGESVKSNAVVVLPLAVPGVEQSRPEVHGVEPTLIAASAERELTVTGAGFASGVTVTVGSFPVSKVELVDDHTLKVTTARNLKSGIYPVIVVNKDLGRGALPQALTVRSGSAVEADSGCSTTGGAGRGLALALLPLALLALRRRRSARIS